VIANPFNKPSIDLTAYWLSKY